MPVVKIPPVLRPSVSGMSEVEVDGGTVGEVLNALADRYPDTGDQLLSSDGELNRYVNVYVNDEDVRVQNGLETSVTPADTVVILPAMAGGGRLTDALLRNIGPRRPTGSSDTYSQLSWPNGPL
jgi:MoaD family protein